MTTKRRNKASVAAQEPLFFKWQLMSSQKLNASPDVLDALLCDDKQYTLAEVKELVEEFMNGKA